jgi:hypothetical protein
MARHHRLRRKTTNKLKIFPNTLSHEGEKDRCSR